MNAEKLKQLDSLLSEFEDAFPVANFTTGRQSIYGRSMDIAMVTSIRSILPSYGLTWEISFTLENGSKEVRGNYVSHNSAVHAANYWMANPEEFDSKPLSYEIL